MAVRARAVVLGFVGLILLVVIGGLTLIGWEVVLGPKARAVSTTPFEATEARLARGKYLVEGPAACFHCHSEHDFSTEDYPRIEAKKGAGWVMPIPELNNIASRNITPDPETGIGLWSDDEVARAIREGVRRDRTALFPLMPYLAFSSMDDEDVKAIVVYLRTIPAVRNVVPKRDLPGPLEYLVNTMPQPVMTPQPSHPASTAVERGRYLVTMAECVACHTAADDKGLPLPGMAYGGGAMFHDPGQGGKAVFSVNITPGPVRHRALRRVALYRDDADRQGQGPDGQSHHAVRGLQDHHGRRPVGHVRLHQDPGAGKAPGQQHGPAGVVRAVRANAWVGRAEQEVTCPVTPLVEAGGMTGANPKVVDLNAYKAAREARQLELLEAVPGAGSAALEPERELTPREIAHRARMLAHLDAAR